MLLADAGASVLRIDRPQTTTSTTNDPLTRRKASLPLNLKDPSSTALLKALLATADILIDPYRPLVLERLNLGPSSLLALNPSLIYARLTGFRRDGRYSAMAGHDINYVALSGALSLLGRAGEPPHPPANMLGDFAGGGAMLVQGILLALLARARGGKGQVVEANMVDGAAYLATFSRMTPWAGRGRNLLDGGCPFYDTYLTKDGKYFSVGALEPRFFDELLAGLRLSHLRESRFDRAEWPALRFVFTKAFREKTRAEWEAIFDGTDACAVPVLDYAELESDAAREGDQRPPVTLRSTPCLAIKHRKEPSDAVEHGQGPGVEGDGYHGRALAPGEGAPEMLYSWLGWKEREHYRVQHGVYVLAKSSSKL